jgi:3-oxoadipate enol-lactonase
MMPNMTSNHGRDEGGARGSEPTRAPLDFASHGEGPAIVLLPPFPLVARVWAGNSPALVAAGYRVLAPDYPGFGASAESPSALSVADIAERAVAMLDAVGVDRAIWIGESMGGYVALAAAAMYADRILALVLADTRATADTEAARAGRASALAAIRDRGPDAYLDEAVPRLLAPDAPEAVRLMARSLAESRGLALAAAVAALRDRPDRTTTLAHLRCPTLVLVGEADQVTPPAEVRAMAATIPGAELVTLPGVGHLTNIEAPEAFNAAIVGFLRQHPFSGRAEAGRAPAQGRA